MSAARSARIGVVGEPHPGHEIAQGRLAIPFLTPAGVVAIRFRSLEETDKAKYLSLAGAQPRLYNVAALHTRQPYVAIVEGELDALALSDLVGVPAVGVPGANSWLKHYARCFADFERVYIITDNDVKHDGDGNLEANPGQKLAKRIAEDIPQATVITPPENCDVNEWILRDGPQKVADAIGVSLLQSADDHVNIALTEKEVIPY